MCLRKKRLCSIVSAILAITLTPLNISAQTNYDSANDITTESVNGGNFYLPERLGKVVLSSKGDVSNGHDGAVKLVIHIQDYHCDYESQKTIKDIVSFLNDRYGVSLINLEGGKGEYDFSVFTDINDISRRAVAAEHYLKKGEINGAELYAILNPDKVKVWGAEDEDLYLNSLSLYQSVLKEKERIDEASGDLRKRVKAALNDVLDDEGVFFIDSRDKYRDKKIKFDDYLKILVRYASKRDISPDTYGSIKKMVEAADMASLVDFGEAEKERGEIIDFLKNNLSLYEGRELAMKLGDFNSSDMGEEEFYSFIFHKARCLSFGEARFINVKKYADYSIYYNSLDYGVLIEESEKLAYEILNNLAKSEKEKKLVYLMSYIDMAAQMFDLNLAKNEYESYLTRKNDFSMEERASLFPGDDFSARLTLLNKYTEVMESFYAYSLKRDEAFLKNMKYQKLPQGTRVAILVTGGFHADNLSSIMKKRGIDFVSIAPNIKGDLNTPNNYMNLLSGSSSIAIASPNSSLGQLARGRIITRDEVAGLLPGKDEGGTPLSHSDLFTSGITRGVIGLELQTEDVPFGEFTAYSSGPGYGNHTLRILNNLSPGDIIRLEELLRTLSSENSIDVRGLWIDNDVDINMVKKFIKNRDFDLVTYDFLEWDSKEKERWGYHYGEGKAVTLRLSLTDSGREIRELAFKAFSYSPLEGAEARDKILSYKQHLSPEGWADWYDVYLGIIVDFEIVATAVRSMWHTKVNDIATYMQIVKGYAFVIMQSNADKLRDEKLSAKIKDDYRSIEDFIEEITSKEITSFPSLLTSLHSYLVRKGVSARRDLFEPELWLYQMEVLAGKADKIYSWYKGEIDRIFESSPLDFSMLDGKSHVRKVFNETLMKIRDTLRGQIDFAKRRLSSDSMPVADIVDAAKELFEGMYPGRIDYEIDEAALGYEMFINKKAVLAVLFNIVNNSLDSQKEPVRVRFSVRKNQKNDGFVTFEISDNREGIPLVNKYGNKTYFLSEGPVAGRLVIYNLNTTERKGGTGLGLNEAWHVVVRMYRGRINVATVREEEDSENHGTTFTIDLPVFGNDADRDNVVESQVQESVKSYIPGLIAGIKSSRRFPDQPVIVLIPDIIADEDKAGEVSSRQKFLRHLKEKYGNGNITVQFYDRGNKDNDIAKKILGFQNELSRQNMAARALVYVEDGIYDEVVSSTIAETRDVVEFDKIYFVKEDFGEYPYTGSLEGRMIETHILLALALVEIARSGYDGDDLRGMLIERVYHLLNIMGNNDVASRFRENWKDIFTGKLSIRIPYSEEIIQNIYATQMVESSA